MGKLRNQAMRASHALLFVAGTLAFAAPTSAGKVSGCSFNGIELKGKVQVVSSFADVQVEVVDSFPDLNVKRVGSFPSSCGEWEFVDSYPDFTIELVTSFPDIQVKYVSSFPGMP
ncbi:MAG: hypothetical protein ABJP70_07230 [Erythrobacter sp.]